VEFYRSSLDPFAFKTIARSLDNMKLIDAYLVKKKKKLKSKIYMHQSSLHNIEFPFYHAMCYHNFSVFSNISIDSNL